MKKKIISLVLSAMLICSLAVTASAASRADYDVVFGDCRYNTYSHCYTNGYNCLAEYNYSPDSATNYAFKINVLTLFTDEVNGEVAKFKQGSSRTMLSQNSHTFDSNIVHHIIPAFYVNNTFSYEFDLYPG